MSPSPDRAAVRRWRRRLADEHLEARVYRHLADRRAGEEREVLLGLAEAEDRHAAHWGSLLGPGVPPGRPSLGHRLLALLARRFGSVFVLALAQQAEGRSPYDADVDATAAMAADERVHEEVVRGLAARGRARVSGAFRAAVFGANDGLVSNVSLVLGVAGAGETARTVLLTGVSGLLAGALSMAAGEFVSVRSQRELLAASAPGTRAAEVVGALDVDANELALVYRARGMPAEQATARADAVLRGRRPTWTGVPPPDGAAEGAPGDRAADGQTPAPETDVIGSGLVAASSSAASFASGALVPVLPFLAGMTGTSALVVAVVLVALALLATGAVVGLLSGGALLARGGRQLAVGAVAAAATFALGSLVGRSLG